MFKNIIKVALMVVVLYYGTALLIGSVGGMLVVLTGSVIMWPLLPLLIALPIAATGYILKKITKH